MLSLPRTDALAGDTATDGAKPFVVQGSTTFTHQVFEPFGGIIEASSGHKLKVVPTKSSQGLIALFERRADFAMISGPLKNEIAGLRSSNPDLAFDRLRTFDILTTRMAFAINRDNPVHHISDDEMRRVLLGEISNWHEVGGADLPISIVMVNAGGGVQSSIESRTPRRQTYQARSLDCRPGQRADRQDHRNNAGGAGTFAAQHRQKRECARTENRPRGRTAPYARHARRADAGDAQGHRCGTYCGQQGVRIGRGAAIETSNPRGFGLRMPTPLSAAQTISSARSPSASSFAFAG